MIGRVFALYALYRALVGRPFRGRPRPLWGWTISANAVTAENITANAITTEMLTTNTVGWSGTTDWTPRLKINGPITVTDGLH